ncbi:MAG: DotI/IcmL/TraM family protein [Legionella sp.]
MRFILQRTLFLILLSVIPLSIYAQDDAEVSQWVKQTLANTLTMDYHYKPSDDNELRTYYTANGWAALAQFLGSYVPIIKERQLSLHPQFIKDPFVVEKGTISGTRFWRVETVVSITELHLMIAFSLIVLETNSPKNGNLMIQSMDMVKKENI